MACILLATLSLRELASAVSIRNPQKVLEICDTSLVSLQWNPYWVYKRDEPHDNVNDLVNFDHFSVKEYLTSGHLLASEELAFFHATPLAAHLTIAEVSVSHLITTNSIDLCTERRNESETLFYGTDWPEFPLLDYSTTWFEDIQHADALAKRLESDRSRSEARSTAKQSKPDFLRTRTHELFCEGFSQSLQNFYYLLRRRYEPGNAVWRYQDSISPIIIALLFNLPDNVRRLIYNRANIGGDEDSSSITKDLYITKPIQEAALRGDLENLNLLLEKKNGNLTQSELDLPLGQTILHWVFQNLMSSNQMLPVTLKLYRDHGVEEEITEAMLVNAASFDHVAPALFDLILGYAKRIVITMTVMEGIFNNGSRHVLMNLLLNDETSGVRYCDKVWDWEYLASFRGEQQTPASMSADEMMEAAAHGEPEAFAYLRAHARPNVTFARTLAEAKSFNADA